MRGLYLSVLFMCTNFLIVMHTDRSISESCSIDPDFDCTFPGVSVPK